MNAETNLSFAKLERRQMIEVREGAGSVIVCLSGLLWVTRQGHGEDFVMGPGQSMALDGRGRAVAQALRSSTLRVIRQAAEQIGPPSGSTSRRSPPAQRRTLPWSPSPQ